MSFYRCFIKLKSMLSIRINYKKLTSEYLLKNRRKAAEEIKQLKHFTHWPIAKVKGNTVVDNPKEIAGTENKLHHLSLYTYQKEIYHQNKALEKTDAKFLNVVKIKKQL